MKLEVKKGISLEVQNYYYRDYTEDDWSVTLVGSSLEELIKSFWNDKYHSSEINPQYFYFSKVEYVTYEGKNIVVKEGEFDKDTEKLYKSKILKSDLRQEALDKRSEILRQRKQKESEEYEKTKKEEELRTLERLKQKYPEK